MVDYMAPEVYYRPLSNAEFTPQTDSFALAILIFQIIMRGCHPFNTARKSYDEEKYSSYSFFYNTELMVGSPYFSAVDNREIPEYAKPYLAGLEPLYPLFCRVFGYDAGNVCSDGQIKGRPSPREWQEALEKLVPDRAQYF